ncbi:MAG: esterase/lipase [Paenibacillaceae bacterium]|nr:esterase/lipase [Paenibacillaceae bacterium]
MIHPVIKHISPSGEEVAAHSDIEIQFDVRMDRSSVETIRVTRNGWDGGPTTGEAISGKWSSIDEQTFTFRPDERFEPGSYVAVQLNSSVRSVEGLSLKHEFPLHFFLVDDGKSYGSKEILLPCIKATNRGKHSIPMHLTLPERGQNHRVMFWVHGGGWEGGSPEKSHVGPGKDAQFLANHLGIAVVSIAYRCKGSSGTFALAMEDVMDAMQYVREHAAEYGLDVRGNCMSGSSAGAPLSALAAQKSPDTDVYIGINGIYNFAGIDRLKGYENHKHYSYKLHEPSPESNSAVCNICDHPPDTLLLHGTVDQVVNHKLSVEFGEAIRRMGGKAKVLLYEGEGHTFARKGRRMYIPCLYEVKEHLRKAWDLQ